MTGRDWITRDLWTRMRDCPFCGAKSEEYNISLSHSEDLQGTLKHIMGECADCGAMGPLARTEVEALHLWGMKE